MTILFHDDETGRLCEKNLVIERTDFKTLRALKFNDGVSRMPTLDEYLKVVSHYGKIAVVELKNRMEESCIREIIDICRRLYSLDRTVFISFDLDNLITVRGLLPEQRIQFLSDRMENIETDLLKEYHFGLDIAHWLLTEEFLEKLHRNGIEINCWTVDDPARAEQLVPYGVDYITTNIMEQL